MVATNPDEVKDVGFFALPGDDASQERPDRCGRRAASTSRRPPRATSSTRPRSSWPSSPARTAATSQTKAVTPTGPYAGQGLHAAGRRAAGDQGHAAVLRQAGRRPARRWSSCRRSRARRWSRSPSRSAPASARPRTAPRSTTRTSRSRPSSSGWRAGRRDVGPPVGRAGSAQDRRPGRADRAVDATRRPQRAAGATARARPYPFWFYLPAAVDLRRAVPGADVRVVLLQPDPVDAVRVEVHRAATTSSRSSRSRRWSRASPTP